MTCNIFGDKNILIGPSMSFNGIPVEFSNLFISKKEQLGFRHFFKFLTILIGQCFPTKLIFTLFSFYYSGRNVCSFCRRPFSYYLILMHSH